MNIYYIGNVAVSGELYHHGILGQEWGKQNGPPYPLDAKDHSKAEQKAGWRKSLNKEEKNSSNTKNHDKQEGKKGLTDKQKKIIKNVLIATAAVGVGTAIAYYTKKGDFLKGYAERDFYKPTVRVLGIDKLDDNDLVFNEGFEFHRISSREVEDYSTSDKVYAAFDPEDVNRYKSILPDFFKAWKKGGMDIDPSKVYDIALKANTEIRSPSAKKRVEAFVNLFEDSSFRSSLSKVLGVTPTDLENEIFWLGGSKKAALSFYEQFALALNAKGEYAEAPKMYFDKIREMGYNALVDDNDAGKLSKTPMILLDPKNNFVVSGGRRVKNLERFIAVMKLKNF